MGNTSRIEIQWISWVVRWLELVKEEVKSLIVWHTPCLPSMLVHTIRKRKKKTLVLVVVDLDL